MRKILFSLLILFASIGIVSAHGLSITPVNAYVVEVSYGHDEPAANAEIKIYSPSAPSEAILGVTDANGRYSFLPYEAGEWRLEAADSMGHKASLAISHMPEIMPDPSVVRDVSAHPTAYFRVFLGVSLILNIFFVYRFIAGRKARAH